MFVVDTSVLVYAADEDSSSWSPSTPFPDVALRVCAAHRVDTRCHPEDAMNRSGDHCPSPATRLLQGTF